jgi:hypothetical protein
MDRLVNDNRLVQYFSNIYGYNLPIYVVRFIAHYAHTLLLACPIALAVKYII